MKFRYRQATSADIPFMTTVLLEAAASSGHFIEPERLADYPDTEIYVKGWHAEKECGVIAETETGEPVGAAWIRNIPELVHNPDKPLPELTVGVLPAFRRKGIGEQLMSELYQSCHTNGITEISLGVHKDNIPAINLYQKHGWKPEGRFEDYIMMSYVVR